MELAGRVFGRWTVLSRAEKDRHWDCRCECGTQRPVFESSLTTGDSPSCGCISREAATNRITHGHARVGKRSPEYATWCRIRARCEIPSATGFANYGGRGIAVCDRWRRSFDAFLADVGFRPSPRYSLDRIDNDRGYEPGNVRWATEIDQANNRRTNRFLIHDGETLTIAQWARKLGLRPRLIQQRLEQGFTDSEALKPKMRGGIHRSQQH